DDRNVGREAEALARGRLIAGSKALEIDAIGDDVRPLTVGGPREAGHEVGRLADDPLGAPRGRPAHADGQPGLETWPARRADGAEQVVTAKGDHERGRLP